MAIYLKTNNPDELLRAFKKKIDDKHVVTWAYDKDGDFTHDVPQWKNQAWLRPRVRTGELALFILSPKSRKITTEVYAIYHGRFIESMLVHCDALFTQGIASAMPETGDVIAAQ